MERGAVSLGSLSEKGGRRVTGWPAVHSIATGTLRRAGMRADLAVR